MLTEDVVIGSLCEHLVAGGWEIVPRAMPNQRGPTSSLPATGSG